MGYERENEMKPILLIFTCIYWPQYQTWDTNTMNLILSNSGQCLQIEKARLEDEAPYECQAGQAESSGAIISSSTWVNMLNEWTRGVWEQGRLEAHKQQK